MAAFQSHLEASWGLKVGVRLLLFFRHGTIDEFIVSRNYRMPIYRTFQHIEKNIVSNLQYRVSRLGCPTLHLFFN